MTTQVTAQLIRNRPLTIFLDLKKSLKLKQLQVNGKWSPLLSFANMSYATEKKIPQTRRPPFRNNYFFAGAVLLFEFRYGFSLWIYWRELSPRNTFAGGS